MAVGIQIYPPVAGTLPPAAVPLPTVPLSPSVRPGPSQRLPPQSTLAGWLGMDPTITTLIYPFLHPHIRFSHYDTDTLKIQLYLHLF